MSSSREDSPDWLHCFKAPTTSTLVLSSDSEPSGEGSPSKKDIPDCEELPLSNSLNIANDDEDLGKVLGGTKSKSPSGKKSSLKSPKKGRKLEDDVSPEKNKSVSRKKRKGDSGGDKKVSKKVTVGSHSESHELNSSVLALSSDFELSPENSPARENQMPHGTASDQETTEQLGDENSEESREKKASKDKPPRMGPETSTKDKNKRDVKQEGNGSDVEPTEEAPEKQVDARVRINIGSYARCVFDATNPPLTQLPLMLSEKVHRTKALVECEGDSIDLGGDMGSVGRVVISDNLSGDHEMYLDLKGTIYKTTIVPSRTFCVVSFGQSEAKIEAIMNDFIQLKPQSNVFEAETMVEGTLDGFLFDSDEEADKVPKGGSHKTDNDEDGVAKANGKTKGKSEKTAGVARKRGKAVGGKSQPQKKVKKKTQAPKKAKARK